MPTSDKVAAQTKTIRETRGLSLADLSERSGCSVELLESIESGQVAPSIAPLARVARALGVRLGTLMDGAEQHGPVVDRAHTRQVVARFADFRTQSGLGTAEYWGLALEKTDRHIEPFLLTLHPETTPQMSSHEGEEFLYVLSGEIEVTYGQQQYSVGQSDSIYFDSVVAHSVRALGQSAAQVLSVIYCPA
jgi:transcriptional regulator with XRE-family HTH domain